MNVTNAQRVVPREAWLIARKALLTKEKELTKARDALGRERRALPWVKVEKDYLFDGPDGTRTLAELFDGRSRLIVYHFMFGPEWSEAQACKSCSFLADHIDGANLHLPHRDVTLLVVSRARIAAIEAFKKRMGWRFTWVSSFGSDFNYDYHVSFTPHELAQGNVNYNYTLQEGNDELPGISVFYKDANGDVFHTYSSYGRGGDLLITTYNYLDLVPKGRDETGPRLNMTDWVRHHDSYDVGDVVQRDVASVAAVTPP